MNARIVGEAFRSDDCLPTGGTGRVWEHEGLPLGPPLAANVLRPGIAAGPRAVEAGWSDDPGDPEAEALTAIMARYEDARARIISADAGPAPTVPVDLGPGLPPRPPQRAHPRRAPNSGEAATTQRGHGPVRSLLGRLVSALR